LGKVAEVLRINNPNATVLTGLGGLVAKAEAERQALTVPVLLADVQLASLALLILVVVAAMAAEARAGEVALAKVRGATTGQAFGLAFLELAVIAALALPAGLAVGWLGAYLLGPTPLAARIPPGPLEPGGPARGRPGRGAAAGGRGRPGQPARLRDPPGQRRLRPARHPRPRPGRAGRRPGRGALPAAGGRVGGAPP